jgi:hypothetical protein
MFRRQAAAGHGMKTTLTQRMTARLKGDFCVFLIGMRINRWWELHPWGRVALAMPRMLRELRAHPEMGLLHAERWFGRTLIFVQYWRSFEALEHYARNPDLAHLPAGAAFTRRVGNSGDVGIWHETNRIAAGQFETIYHYMPPFGLGRAAALEHATGSRETARGRLGKPRRPGLIKPGGTPEMRTVCVWRFKKCASLANARQATCRPDDRLKLPSATRPK